MERVLCGEETEVGAGLLNNEPQSVYVSSYCRRQARVVSPVRCVAPWCIPRALPVPCDLLPMCVRVAPSWLWRAIRHFELGSSIWTVALLGFGLLHAGRTGLCELSLLSANSPAVCAVRTSHSAAPLISSRVPTVACRRSVVLCPLPACTATLSRVAPLVSSSRNRRAAAQHCGGKGRAGRLATSASTLGSTLFASMLRHRSSTLATLATRTSMLHVSICQSSFRFHPRPVCCLSSLLPAQPYIPYASQRRSLHNNPSSLPSTILHHVAVSAALEASQSRLVSVHAGAVQLASSH